MFGIGTWELILILALALLILGPSKMPEVARNVGRTLAKLRQAADEVKREIHLDEIKNEIENIATKPLDFSPTKMTKFMVGTNRDQSVNMPGPTPAEQNTTKPQETDKEPDKNG